MTLNLNCSFGLFKANVQAPPVPPTFGGQELGFFLERASRVSGAPGIQVTSDSALSPSSLRPLNTPTDLFNLHISLASMLQNPIDGRRISRVGVLYADSLAGHPGLFGLMFDQGFPGPQVPASFARVPREGCAVFLTAILQHRQALNDFFKETLFTTAHELSHVFNLWHVAERSFLARSDLRQPPFDIEAYHYAAEHATFLQNMDSPEVFPGGTPFGVRGRLGPPDPDAQSRPVSSAVRVTLAASTREFWHFEPVELTMMVAPASRTRSGRPLVLPDTIDPGYESCDIWITAPDGTRRRYRSPALYCTNAGTISLTTNRPFRRDLPIFGQSGGYTFRQAGLHRVMATLTLPDGHVVRSNVLDLMVKESRPRQPEYVRLHDVLTTRSMAQLLFYKSTRSHRSVDEQITRAKGVRHPATRASILFASAVAILKRPATRHQVARARSSRAAALLESALDSGRLTDHQQRKAARYLAERD